MNLLISHTSQLIFQKSAAFNFFALLTIDIDSPSTVATVFCWYYWLSERSEAKPLSVHVN